MTVHDLTPAGVSGSLVAGAARHAWSLAHGPALPGRAVDNVAERGDGTGGADVLLPQRATRELLALQSSILARAAAGGDIDELLDAICRMIEDPVAGVTCTILLVEGPALIHAAAPGMPVTFTDAIDGVHWGPDRGSCGTTAYTGEPTLVKDIATDERWAPWRDVALTHGLRACWSVPVFSRDNDVIATFAAYATDPRMPDAGELELLEHASYLVSVLLEQHNDRERLKAVTERLVATNRDLLAASRAKDDFLSMTSHELRTPLTPMIGMVETLQMRWERLTDEQRRSLLEVVARQATRLHHLVDDLLTMSAAAAGELRAQPQVVDVLPAINLALTSMLGPEADVPVEAEPGLQVVTDARHLQQILENYLSNAIKYADSGPVRVTARAEGDEVTLCVVDAGEGIDPSLVHRLFKPFTRLDTGDRRRAQGTGVGLAVVRTLADVNKGRAWYEPAETGGACFAVALPAPDA